MSRIIITRELECKSCNKKNDYSSSEVVHDHLICKSCGHKMKIVVNLDEIDDDYKSINGTTVRKIPKIKMSKKQRRKLKSNPDY